MASESPDIERGMLDITKPKWFGTFPYPYMNGPLHLGHAFTAAKVEFTARYKEMKGFNVLFPFGFHCTGTPIHAMASKLSRGDKIVAAILTASGVKEDEISEFTDPAKWVSYFPQKGMHDMKKMSPMVDWDRSFYTTSLNPWYDSFVRWQFNKLKSLGYIEFGTRQSIVTPTDGQLCADHDRSIGEGILPVKAHLVKAGGLFYLKHLDESAVSQVTIEIDRTASWEKTTDGTLISSRLRYHVDIDVKSVVPTDPVFGVATIAVIPNDKWTWFERLSGFRFITSVPEVDPILTTVHVTSEKVVSRTGIECTVRETEQWFIKYGDPEWKARVKKYIEEKLETPNRTVKEQLLVAVEWLREWGFSRSADLGLGTKIPWDDRFIIDSLSDSTLYMAYYTVAHMMTTDGMSVPPTTLLVPSEELSDDFWESIFCQLPGSPVLHGDSSVINVMRELFRYWYPVDLRVSGKDLIYNHLLMCLYNHIAIFGEELTPKSFSCNGYITIDGKKMSKSSGNFVTLSDAVDHYGLTSLRLILADAGDGLNDANFNTRNIEPLTKHLAAAVKWHEDHVDVYREFSGHFSSIDKSRFNLIDRIFFNELCFYWNEANDSFERIRHKDALKHALFHLTAARETYDKCGRLLGLPANPLLHALFSFMQVWLLYPIVPDVMEHIYHDVFCHSRMKYRDTVSALVVVDHELKKTCSLVDEIVSKANHSVQRMKSKAKSVTGIVVSVVRELDSEFKSLISAKIGGGLMVEIISDSSLPSEFKVQMIT